MTIDERFESIRQKCEADPEYWKELFDLALAEDKAAKAEITRLTAENRRLDNCATCGGSGVIYRTMDMPEEKGEQCPDCEGAGICEVTRLQREVFRLTAALAAGRETVLAEVWEKILCKSEAPMWSDSERDEYIVMHNEARAAYEKLKEKP